VVAGALLLGQGNLGDPALERTLLELRATRVGAAFLAGAALAVGGVVLQGLFRNPLVSPSILGTTSGALLGGQMALLALATLAPGAVSVAGVGLEMVMSAGCLLGAGVALGILLLLSRARGGTLMLILTGFILMSLFLALASFVTSLAQDSWDLGRAVVNFTLGGVAGISRAQLLVAAPLVLASAVALWLWGGTLDVLLSGEEEASTLGVDVAEARRWIIVWVAALTGAAVSVGGNIAFVGLIVPHVLRPRVGVQHRRLIPAAALLGGTFVVACDVVVRVLPTRSELPLGVLTDLVGAPVFLILLARAHRELAHG
jgi:iron complex transport system permease protein